MLSSLIRQDILPVGVGYLLVMGTLAAGLWLIRRRPADAAAGPARATGASGPRPGWGRLIRHYAGTAAGGYLLLMAVVILYYYGVARVGGAFIASAFSGCALLIALATPVFLAASWVAERRRRRAAGVSGSGRRPGTP